MAESFLEKKANGCQLPCVCCCKTAPTCVSDASVAKESLADGCGCCNDTAYANSDLAVSKASCMSGVQDSWPVPDMASVSGLRTFAVPGKKQW